MARVPVRRLSCQGLDEFGDTEGFQIALNASIQHVHDPGVDLLEALGERLCEIQIERWISDKRGGEILRA